MDIGEQIAKNAITSIVSNVVALFKDYFVGAFRNREKETHEFRERLTQHMREISNWSRHVQFMDKWPAPMDTDSKTISLSIRTAPRRLRLTSGEVTDETIFFKEPGNYVLLGAPGSGKTTTLKRVIRRFFEEASCEQDHLQYPICLLLRDYDPDLGLYKSIANAIGVKYNDVETFRSEKTGQTIKKTMIGNVPICKAITDILNQTKAFLLLDGLDEVPYSVYADLVKAINVLSYSLEDASILYTCRLGYLTHEVLGFKLLELSDLSNLQVRQIAEMWLGDPEPFMKELSQLPYKDLINRPLMLAQLMCIYSYDRKFPDDPHNIYHSIIILLLREWDRRRGLERRTKYSRFDPDSKLRFLSSLSYELTYKIKAKTFTDIDLRNAYDAICLRHRLPREEALEVAKEVESHSGIITQCGGFKFEFSHLSLQEYLCAAYIVKESRASHIIDYIKEFPSPLAIAVALASEPSTWFADIYMRFESAFNEHSLSAFLSRLCIEQPRFEPNRDLGIAILAMLSKSHHMWPQLNDILESFINLQYVFGSIGLSLLSYYIDREASEEGHCFVLLLKEGLHARSSCKIETTSVPKDNLLIPKDIIIKAINISGVRMSWRQWMKDRPFVVLDDQYYYE